MRLRGFRYQFHLVVTTQRRFEVFLIIDFLLLEQLSAEMRGGSAWQMIPSGASIHLPREAETDGV